MIKSFKIAFALIVIMFSSQLMAQSLPGAGNLYKQLQLDGKVSYQHFKRAYSHFQSSDSAKPVFTLIDYSKPSSKKRFWVINAKQKRIVFSSYVSHGKNSGSLYAREFSNTVNSRQTSLGVYRASETYFGKHGYSLRLDGMSKGVNDNARKRAIVIHGAAYANPKVITKTGQLGRSWGCPALPSYLSKKVINEIKDGTYIYAFA